MKQLASFLSKMCLCTGRHLLLARLFFRLGNVLNLLLGRVGNEKLVCNNHRLQSLELHRDIAAVIYQRWRFYLLSNLQSAFRMGLSFTPTQLLYTTYWCTKLRGTWKCDTWPALFPDDDLLSSGRTSYSFTVEVTPSLHAASWVSRER